MTPNLADQVRYIWLEAILRMEEYDRTLPGTSRYGNWLPVYDGRVDGPGLSRAFYRRVIVETKSRLAELGLSADSTEGVYRELKGLSEKELRREWEWMQDAVREAPIEATSRFERDEVI